MRGKAERDSPVCVLLTPPGEYDWIWIIRPDNFRSEIWCPHQISWKSALTFWRY